MPKTENYTCVRCPMGCPLRLAHEGKKIVEVSGNECNRGAKYARQEFTEPRRELSTTVAISGGLWARLPVKVKGGVHKKRVLEAAREIHKLRAKAPVKAGQVLLKNLLGEKGADVVACRTMRQVGG
ncbi:MAG: DUF1667 domain-containing protein [Elusimicrobiota bacterium]